MLDLFRSLSTYSVWANGRVLDTAALLTPQQFTASEGDAPSVRDILVHLLAAQRVWQERLRGAPITPWPQTADFPDVATLRAAWETLDAEWRVHMATLSEDVLRGTLTYVNNRGETWSYLYWQAMMQELNHATQHRSEIAWLLTEAGHSPGDLDYLVYIDGR